MKTDAGAQTETAAQALYPQGVRIKFLSFPYYICLHIDANYFTPAPVQLHWTVFQWGESNLSDSLSIYRLTCGFTLKVKDK